MVYNQTTLTHSGGRTMKWYSNIVIAIAFCLCSTGFAQDVQTALAESHIITIEEVRTSWINIDLQRKILVGRAL